MFAREEEGGGGRELRRRLYTLPTPISRSSPFQAKINSISKILTRAGRTLRINLRDERRRRSMERTVLRFVHHAKMVGKNVRAKTGN